MAAHRRPSTPGEAVGGVPARVARAVNEPEILDRVGAAVGLLDDVVDVGVPVAALDEATA